MCHRLFTLCNARNRRAGSKEAASRCCQTLPFYCVGGVPGIFSDLALEPETGDVGGIEIIIIPAYYNDWATVVIGDSIPENPVPVSVTRNGNKIEFTLPPDRPEASEIKFTGKITRSGLRLHNEGFGVQWLPRQWRTR